MNDASEFDKHARRAATDAIARIYEQFGFLINFTYTALQERPPIIADKYDAEYETRNLTNVIELFREIETEARLSAATLNTYLESLKTVCEKGNAENESEI